MKGVFSASMILPCFQPLPESSFWFGKEADLTDGSRTKFCWTFLLTNKPQTILISVATRDLVMSDCPTISSNTAVRYSCQLGKGSVAKLMQISQHRVTAKTFLLKWKQQGGWHQECNSHIHFVLPGGNIPQGYVRTNMCSFKYECIS